MTWYLHCMSVTNALTAAYNRAFVYEWSGGMWSTVKKGQHFPLMYGATSPEPKLVFWLLLKFAALLTSAVSFYRGPFPNSHSRSVSPTRLLFCHVWRVVGLRAEKTEWTQLDANSQGECPPSPPPLQIYGLTCALRSGQTPLFHFLRLPRCRSNSGEANAGRLLNYERWAWVIPVIKSKGAGPMPHGTMVLLCLCSLRCGLWMKFLASARKLSKQVAFHFIGEIMWVQRN